MSNFSFADERSDRVDRFLKRRREVVEVQIPDVDGPLFRRVTLLHTPQSHLRPMPPRLGVKGGRRVPTFVAMIHQSRLRFVSFPTISSKRHPRMHQRYR